MSNDPEECPVCDGELRRQGSYNITCDDCNRAYGLYEESDGAQVLIDSAGERFVVTRGGEPA